MSIGKTTAFFIGSAFIASGLYAGPIISNLGAVAVDAPSQSALDFGAGAEIGAQFTMGATSFDLVSFTLRIEAIGTRSLGPNDVTVSIYGGDTTSPSGSPLLTIAPSGPFNGQINEYTYTAPAAFTLSANTLYWLVAGAVQNQEGWIVFDNTIAGAQPTGAFATAPLAVNRSASGLPTGLSSNTGAVAFEADGTAVNSSPSGVPEPSTFALMIIAIASFAGYRSVRARGFAQSFRQH